MAKSSIFVLGSFVISCSAKVERFPRAGESLQARRVAVEPGGKGFNLALGAARLGGDVDGLLAIGDDFLAAFAAPALESAGLPAAMLRRFPGRTGSGIGFTDASGENCLAVDPGVNLDLSAEEVRAVGDQIRSAGLVLAQFEIADPPILAAFSLARASGGRTMLNPSPFRPLSPELLAATSILIVNTAEAAALATSLAAHPATDGERAEYAWLDELARALFARGPDTLIVTRGTEGAIAFRKDEAPISQSAFEVDALDTLGAGDAFAAGLAASLAEGDAFATAMRRAAGCGALSARTMGVFHALPQRAELDCFLEVRR